MHTLVTIVAQVALIGVAVYVALVTWRRSEDAHGWFLKAEAQALKLRAERDRVTVLEREVDALRRELRKLSGKFHAAQREREYEGDPDSSPRPGPNTDGYRGDEATLAALAATAVCENWALAKQEGPTSKAAGCECLYCMTQRADRARVRAALVPKGARATAATATINAGKP